MHFSPSKYNYYYGVVSTSPFALLLINFSHPVCMCAIHGHSQQPLPLSILSCALPHSQRPLLTHTSHSFSRALSPLISLILINPTHSFHFLPTTTSQALSSRPLTPSTHSSSSQCLPMTIHCTNYPRLLVTSTTNGLSLHSQPKDDPLREVSNHFPFPWTFIISILYGPSSSPLLVTPHRIYALQSLIALLSRFSSLSLPTAPHHTPFPRNFIHSHPMASYYARSLHILLLATLCFIGWLVVRSIGCGKWKLSARLIPKTLYTNPARSLSCTTCYEHSFWTTFLRLSHVALSKANQNLHRTDIHTWQSAQPIISRPVPIMVCL